MPLNASDVKAMADDGLLIEVARRRIEDVLVEWRDARISELGRGNGLVIREKDGSPSSTIRFGSETAMRIGLRAIAEFLATKHGA